MPLHLLLHLRINLYIKYENIKYNDHKLNAFSNSFDHCPLPLVPKGFEKCGSESDLLCG